MLRKSCKRQHTCVLHFTHIDFSNVLGVAKFGIPCTNIISVT